MDYIGYKGKIGFGEATLATGGAAAPITLAVDIVVAAIPFIMAAIGRGKPNPNDWMGWNALDAQYNQPIGTSPQGWILKDGDSVTNEALNILQYIRNYGTTNIFKYSIEFKRIITPEDLANKLRRGGYSAEADQLLNQATQPASGITSLFTGKTTNTYVLYGVIALGILLILKK